MKMNLAEEIQELCVKLFEELKTKSKILVTEEEYDEGRDIIYTMPRIYKVEKYSTYVEYIILEIQEGGVLKCGGLGEDFGELVAADISELTTDSACILFNLCC